MKLLVDAGNTRIKFAWLGPGPAGVPCAPQALERDALDSLAQRVGQHVPESVHASNVAGPAVRVALEHACQSAWGLAVQWHDGRTGQGWLRNRYSNPASLGSDRWLGLLGLIHHLQTADPAPAAGTACLLASFGTATTIDTLVWHGLRAPAATFLGGLILPGVTLMAHSLARETADLPLAQGPLADFPLDTHAAIASGIAAAQVGALLRQLRLASVQHPLAPPQVWVTGGALPQIRAELGQRLPDPVAQLDHPVLDGLALLAGPPHQVAGQPPRAAR